jgi:hypothetical protein
MGVASSAVVQFARNGGDTGQYSIYFAPCARFIALLVYSDLGFIWNRDLCQRSCGTLCSDSESQDIMIPQSETLALVSGLLAGWILNRETLVKTTSDLLFETRLHGPSSITHLASDTNPVCGFG